MIIVVGGIKGGSGKTTVATNLAVIRAKDGRDVQEPEDVFKRIWGSPVEDKLLDLAD